MIEAVFLHIPGEAQPPIDVRLAAAAAAGVLASLAMAIAMRMQPGGTVPPFAVAAALSGRSSSEVSRSMAATVHILAGALAGAAFEGLLIGYERVREPIGITVEVVIANLITLSEVLAVATVVGALYVLFSRGVLPRSEGERERLETSGIRRTWALSLAVYAVALLASVTLVFGLLS